MPKRGLNRERLVVIAHEYVRANGLDALTMRRLAAAAEVTPGALYKHLRDKRDLERAMADAIFATVDLTGLDTAHSSADQVITCCTRMRAAMLAFRDGGRIVAGAFSPFAATLVVSGTLRTLLRAITAAEFDAGELALVLRSYTVGFVIEEQAYLALADAGEWEPLVRSLAEYDGPRADSTTDVADIMSGDRDSRFAAGLTAILTGTIRTVPDADLFSPDRLR